jgi:hypothetical protein
MKYYVVKYTGPFGFIKPWTAVRDTEVFSQQFLTPSIVMGMERKLFPELLTVTDSIVKIKGHRLSYDQMSEQQEQIQPRGWNKKRIDKRPAFIRDYAILTRNVLLNPVLSLAFTEEEDARRAFAQHICLCRNEDVLLPFACIEIAEEAFNTDTEYFNGFELVFEERAAAFIVGYNRYQEAKPMYGWLRVVGNPINAFL